MIFWKDFSVPKTRYLILTLLIFLHAIPSWACKCQYLSEQEQIEKADAIFVGKLFASYEMTHIGLVDFIVPIKLIKLNENAEEFFPDTPHDEQDRVELTSHLNECNYTFEKDKVYKIYAYVDETEDGRPHLTTSVCTLTDVFEKQD